MENRIKSQYGDDEVIKGGNTMKSGILSNNEFQSNEIPIIDFYPSEDEYKFEADDFIELIDKN